MITLLQLVESLDNITPDSVDAQLKYLWDQRMKRRADLLLIGHSEDGGVTATVHYANRSMVTDKSAVLQRFVAQTSQLTPAVYQMNTLSDTVGKLVDFMCTGIYGYDALAEDWREKKIPNLCTNVGMYTMAIVLDMPRLKHFVMAVIERTYQFAFRQDQIVAIFNAWMTPLDNSDLQSWLLAWEFDAMKTAGFTMDDWLQQTERRYRHEEFEARFRRSARDWGYYPYGA